MGEVAVLTPTLRRPESLARALRSLAAQDRLDLIDQVVVVDNSPEGSARALVEAVASGTGLALTYVHEPRPGVATARNAGLAAIRAPFVAFLDDDQEAPPHWLSSLFEAHRRLGAAVTFGPCRGASAAPAWKRAYLDAFFSRAGPAQTGPTDQLYGCGNALMTRAGALDGDRPFDPAYDQVGGEDDRLFQALKRRGARFAWCAEAWVVEHAPPHRSRIAYALRRAFSYGQTPATDAAHLRDWPGVARWMAIGAAQAAVYGAAAAALWLVGAPARLSMTDRAVRGLGKVIWWTTPRFYGQAEAQRTAARAPSLAGGRLTRRETA